MTLKSERVRKARCPACGAPPGEECWIQGMYNTVARVPNHPERIKRYNMLVAKRRREKEKINGNQG